MRLSHARDAMGLRESMDFDARQGISVSLFKASLLSARPMLDERLWEENVVTLSVKSKFVMRIESISRSSITVLGGQFQNMRRKWSSDSGEKRRNRSVSIVKK